MHTPSKVGYLLQIIRKNPGELIRLFAIALTTVKYRYLFRCVGKGTTVESRIRIINSPNVQVGDNCLLKEGIYIRAGIQGKVIIEDRVALNSFCHIFGHGYVHIGEDTQIGPGTLITTTDHDYDQDMQTRYRPVKIGKGVWIGGNATILPGVTVGDYSVIGAGAVVTRDIPARSVAVGVPAKVIKRLSKSVEHHNVEEQEGSVNLSRS